MNFKRLIIPQWRSWRWAIRLALIALSFSLLTAFVADNFVMVETRLIVWKFETRLAWSLLLAAVLGFWIGLQTGRLRR